MSNEKNIPLVKPDKAMLARPLIIPFGTLVVGLLIFGSDAYFDGGNFFQKVAAITTAVLKALFLSISTAGIQFLWVVYSYQKKHDSTIDLALTKLEEHYKIGSLLEHMQKIDGVAPYHNMMKEHASLDKLMRVFTDALMKTTNNNGIIIPKLFMLYGFDFVKLKNIVIPTVD